jgi:hypothetical protein
MRRNRSSEKGWASHSRLLVKIAPIPLDLIILHSKWTKTTIYSNFRTAAKVWVIKDYWALAKVLHSLTKINNKYMKKEVRLISKYMVIIYRRSLLQTSLTLPTTLIIRRRLHRRTWALNWRMKKPKTVFFNCLSTNKDRGHHPFLKNSKDREIILTTRRKHKRLAAKMLWWTKL